MFHSLLALLLLLPGLSLAQQAFTYHISGKIGALNAPNKVYLTYSDQVGRVDSATLTNGAFALQGTAELPTRANLVVQANGYHPNAVLPTAISLFLEPTPVVVLSEGSLRAATTTITGGPLTTEYQQLLTSVPPKATPQQYAQAYAAFIKAHPTSWVSLLALWDMGFFASRHYEEVGPLYAGLSPELKSSRPGRIYGDLVQGLKATTVGQLAPNFTKKTPAGKSVSLADYRGKYVLLAFWTSCPSCRTENPNLVKAYQAFKGPKFDVVGVSLDTEDNRERWLTAIADDHLAWTQLSDLDGLNREVERLYGYPGTPQNLLIDPSGKIVAADLQGTDLQATLAHFLK
jgi:peroxiredoxin